MSATPHMCPKCSTTTWAQSIYVVKCRICGYLWHLSREKSLSGEVT